MRIGILAKLTVLTLALPVWGRPGGGSSFHSSSSSRSGTSTPQSSSSRSGSSQSVSGRHYDSAGDGVAMSGDELWFSVLVFFAMVAGVLLLAMLANRAKYGASTFLTWPSRLPKGLRNACFICLGLFLLVPPFRALVALLFFLSIPCVPVLVALGGVLYAIKSGAMRDRGSALGGPSPVLRAMLDEDPNFSLPVFREFVVLLYSQAMLERPNNFPHSRPYLSEAASRTLTGRSRALSVTDVVVGACLLESARVQGDCIQLRVRFESNYIEKLADAEQAIIANETWTFTRKLGSLTRIPEGTGKLACPGCGFAGDFPSAGECPQCNRTNSQGQLDWLVSRIIVIGLETFKPHQDKGGGVEAGTHLPTVIHPQLLVRQREMEARHPDFAMPEFEHKVREVFLAINQAWNDRDWARARPYETDALFRTHRYWIDDYLRKGQVNRLEQIQLNRIVVSNIVLDAFYESITVRLFAQMTDCTIDASNGKVLFGDAKRPRAFTEYWTFVRRVGYKTGRGGGNQCPSCGAPLDRVNQAGICEYCDILITKGDFGWILSNIEQDEVYRLSF